MFKASAITVLSIASLSWSGLSIAAPPAPREDYHCSSKENHPTGISPYLVAQSQLIVEGNIQVPVNKMRSMLSSKRSAYVDLRFSPIKVFKGISTREMFSIKYYPEEDSYSPCPNALINLNKGNVIVFLLKVDDPDATGFYFSGDTPYAIVSIEKGIIARLQNEIKRQEKILEKPRALYKLANSKTHKEVKSLIKEALLAHSQEKAFRELEKLGMKAVPSIILLMDDRRQLPIPELSLVNDSHNSFEGLRHYGPKLMVDALAAILNQITGRSFGFIYNGGSESERRHVVDGWKIYLSEFYKQDLLSSQRK